MSTRTTIGVLALQGDVREHSAALEAAGATTVAVRRAQELEALDGIVIPGGESTTISKLLDVFELREPLQRLLDSGLPAFGSCAGMIMLATDVEGGVSWQRSLGCIDMTVQRNAFGRQVDSFETDLDVAGLDGGPLHAVFIRAPWVKQVGPDVEVLARVHTGDDTTDDGRIVAVRQGPWLATAFHPEVGGDHRMHELFVAMARGEARTVVSQQSIHGS